jgi:hypothetical protein
MGVFVSRYAAEKVHARINALGIMGDVLAEQRQKFFAKAHSQLLTTQRKDVKVGKQVLTAGLIMGVSVKHSVTGVRKCHYFDVFAGCFLDKR